MQKLVAAEEIRQHPMTRQVAAISCGIVEGEGVLDLDYAEDSTAEADANFVLSSDGGIVEIQATAEADPFTPEQFTRLFELARIGTATLFDLQRQAVAGRWKRSRNSPASRQRKSPPCRRAGD